MGLFEAMKDFDERYFKSRIGLSKVYELINQNLFKKNLLKLSASDSWTNVNENLYYENWITIQR